MQRSSFVKRGVALLLILVMGITLMPMADSAAAKKTTATVKMKAKSIDTYVFASMNKTSSKVYFNGKSDIPYLDLEEQRAEIQESYNTDNPGATIKAKTKGDKLIWTKKANGLSFRVIFNFKKNTIYFDDVNGFFREAGSSLVGVDSAHPPYNVLMEDSGSYNRYGRSYTINLNKYGVKLLKDKKREYIPMQTYSDVFMAPTLMTLCYNGKCILITTSTSLPDDLKEIYYKSAPKKMSKEYAAFNYGELCLALDFLYGPKETHDIKSFDEFFTETGLAQYIKSQDATQTDIALKTAINLYFDDGHCYLGTNSSNTDREAYKAVTDGIPMGAYKEKMNIMRTELIETRKQYFPDGFIPYQEIGDTAFITFDSFTMDDEKDHTVLPTDEELPELGADTFRLIQYAVGKITRENSPIKRVVLDLSVNGGGKVVTACYLIAAFLGNSSIALKDINTGAMSLVRKKADTNLDGKFDEKDTLAGRGLKFYCLTSEFSYSCANMVSCMFKDSGKVTLIGRTTGGGSCCVQPLSTASGTLLSISGSKRFSFSRNGDFYDCDRGAIPDFYMDDMSKLYDRNYMVGFLDRIAA